MIQTVGKIANEVPDKKTIQNMVQDGKEKVKSLISDTLQNIPNKQDVKKFITKDEMANIASKNIKNIISGGKEIAKTINDKFLNPSDEEDDVKKPLKAQGEDDVKKPLKAPEEDDVKKPINKPKYNAPVDENEPNLYESISNNLFKEIPEDEKYIIKCVVDEEEHVEDELNLQMGQVLYKNHKRDIKDYWTPKDFGMGESSYFFDLLEDTLKDTILGEFKQIYELAMRTTPFSNCTDSNFKIAEGAVGVTYCQVERIASEWIWDTKETPYDLFHQFDLDFNGVLSPREFILFAIETNKNTFEETHHRCQHCLIESQKLIKQVFEEIDYCQNGKITSKDIWKVLKFLKNKDSHNIFKCPILNYRTPSVNDFVLKSNAANNVGYLSRGQFTRGILLGFWNRQIRGGEIADNDEFSKMSERWQNGEDVICNQIYKERNKNQ